MLSATQSSPSELDGVVALTPRVEGIGLELHGIAKRFGAISALRGVDLQLYPGKIHALIGENGAGKSTLGRVIAGAHAPDDGVMRVDGHPVRYHAPRAALDDGITMIAQELMLVPRRSVLENVFLGNSRARFGFVRVRELERRFVELCRLVGFSIDPHLSVGSLRLADQQKVEILRAVAREARLIVMDEPTAALGGEDADLLLDIMRRLRDRGTTIVFVTHFLQHVLAVADTVAVLRDGELVHACDDVSAETADSLVTAMLGRSLDKTFPARTTLGVGAPTVLSVRGLTRRGAIDNVSFDVHEGEIVALGGLVGSGRTELVRTIFGAEPPDGGTIAVDGVDRRFRHPRGAVRAGLALVPESRKDQGLVMAESIRHNVSLPHLGTLSSAGLLRLARERRDVASAISKLDVRGTPDTARVSALSGGNQQKTLFAKWLLRTPRVLIADEPTRGVDVGAKQSIYQLLADLAASGMAVLVVSSEMEEVLGLAHRILVMRGGSIAAELDGPTATEATVLQAAFGSGGTT